MVVTLGHEASALARGLKYHGHVAWMRMPKAFKLRKCMFSMHDMHGKEAKALGLRVCAMGLSPLSSKVKRRWRNLL